MTLVSHTVGPNEPVAFAPLSPGLKGARCLSTPRSGEVLVRLAPGRYEVSVCGLLSGTIEVVPTEEVLRVASIFVERAHRLPLLCVIPVCEKDVNQALDLLRWVEELGGCPTNPLLLVLDCKVAEPLVEALKLVAKYGFSEVHVIRTPHSLPDEKWPIGPTWMFETAVKHIHSVWKRPFWWNEPDCIPLEPGWLTTLQDEYYECGRQFLGCIVEAQGGQQPAPRHLTGNAVYPPNAIDYVRHTFRTGLAWDIASHQQVVPHAKHTTLFQHDWGDFDRPPTFSDLTRLRPGAVVFHRCKDGSLIRLLRQRRRG
jgi:hypothetical protein